MKNEEITEERTRMRAEIRKIIEKGLRFAITSSIASINQNASFKWCVTHWRGDDLVDDILHTWLEDEDGDIAIDRLVNLLIY